MHTELELRKDYLQEKKIESIYFGGGTPSLLNAEEIFSFIDHVKKYFTAEGAEITLEANPDDLTPDKINSFKQAGINRLSIGIQSFRDEDLKWMNRIHSSDEAISSVKDAQKAGIENISVDLIYGIPELSDEAWKENINCAVSLDVPHISAYCLTVEPHTALAHMVKNKKSKAVDEEQASKHFLSLLEILEKNNYTAYEISNFGKDGFFSRHNSSYWKGKHYLGIGPSAHSYNGDSRSFNIRNNNLYVKNIQEGVSFSETEILSRENKYNEHIMTRLRTIWGVYPDDIEKEFGSEIMKHFSNSSYLWLQSGHLHMKNDALILTPEGKLLGDKIIGELFI